MTRSIGLVGYLLALLMFCGCSDSTLVQLDNGEWGPAPADDDDAASDDDDDAGDDDDGSPYDDGTDDDDAVVDDDDTSDGNDDDDDDDDGPPPDRISECPPNAAKVLDFYAPDGGDEIYVLSWNNSTATATLEAPLAGLYDIYDTDVAESGASQTNETGFIRIANDHNPSGEPVWANCGDDWVVPDSDNSGAPLDPWSYLGTFDLNEGDNTITLSHWCPVFRAGECDWFHIGDPDGASGCNDTGGANSIHVNADGFCMIPRSP